MSAQIERRIISWKGQTFNQIVAGLKTVEGIICKEKTFFNREYGGAGFARNDASRIYSGRNDDFWTEYYNNSGLENREF